MSEATPEDRVEQQLTPTGDVEQAPAPAVPLEAPEADVVEQAVEVEQDEEERR